jgi:hypothetical protein
MNIGRLNGSFKHGMKGTRIYSCWVEMRRRCRDKKRHDYSNYGGRGIKVCPEWNDFIAFYCWAQAAGYDDALTIERLDNGGDYCPENCVFATPLVQGSNKRNNVRIMVDGNYLTLSQISRRYGLSIQTLRYRHYTMGLDGDDLVKPSKFYQHARRVSVSAERRMEV